MSNNMEKHIGTIASCLERIATALEKATAEPEYPITDRRNPEWMGGHCIGEGNHKLCFGQGCHCYCHSPEAEQ